MKSKKGSLTIEASIALTAFMFVVVTILSFATVYRAQNLVSHATLQTSQALAIESFSRETISKSKTMDLASKLVTFCTWLGFDVAGVDDGYASLGASGTNFHAIVRKTFAHSIADNETEADKVLEARGVKDGLDGMDFSYSAVKDGEIIIHVKYEVNLPFSFFGKYTASLSKSAKTKAFMGIDDNNGYDDTIADGSGGSFTSGGGGAGGSAGGGGR